MSMKIVSKTGLKDWNDMFWLKVDISKVTRPEKKINF